MQPWTASLISLNLQELGLGFGIKVIMFFVCKALYWCWSRDWHTAHHPGMTFIRPQKMSELITLGEFKWIVPCSLCDAAVWIEFGIWDLLVCVVMVVFALSKFVVQLLSVLMLLSDRNHQLWVLPRISAVDLHGPRFRVCWWHPVWNSHYVTKIFSRRSGIGWCRKSPRHPEEGEVFGTCAPHLCEHTWCGESLSCMCENV